MVDIVWFIYYGPYDILLTIPYDKSPMHHRFFIGVRFSYVELKIKGLIWEVQRGSVKECVWTI